MGSGACKEAAEIKAKKQSIGMNGVSNNTTFGYWNIFVYSYFKENLSKQTESSADVVN